MTMLHPGDRVLVLTSYGELPARVASVEAGRWMVHVEHPGLPPRIAVWDHEVRRPLDGAADERMKMPERLFTAKPAYLPEPLYYPGGEFGPQRRRRRA